MHWNYLFLMMISCMPFTSCTSAEKNNIPVEKLSKPTELILVNTTGANIEERFSPPAGYKRKPFNTSTFEYYLRNLPLKPHGAQVMYYNGAFKTKIDVYDAVIDLSIGNRDLHQCADAVMRLYAEYLFTTKRYADICFNFLSDGKPRCYLDHVKADRTYAAFWKYLEYVFAFANTTSLFNQMKPVKHIKDLKVGDAFIEKRVPYGHAVLVVDMAVNAKGEKVFLLVQSYMPAQEIHVLKNPVDADISPWYRIPKNALITPEWKFEAEHARRF